MKSAEEHVAAITGGERWNDELQIAAFKRIWTPIFKNIQMDALEAARLIAEEECEAAGQYEAGAGTTIENRIADLIETTEN